MTAFDTALIAPATPLPRLQLIGQCINPARRADIAQALRDADYAMLAGLARAQFDAGARYIDLCAALPGLDEAAALRELLAAVRDGCPDAVPVLDSPDPAVFRRALRGQDGPLVLNSTTAEPERLAAMLDLAGEHDAQLIALAMFRAPGALDERMRALEAIVARADAVGFERERLIADCLALAECGQPGQARITLDALALARAQFGLRTVLGISNVSEGLPGRSALRRALLAMAVARGLDFALCNPLDDELLDECCALRLLTGHDSDCLDFIARMRTRGVGP